MILTILGCGNAFGSGGRLQTSFHVATEDTNFLIDCGATALIALEKAGLEPSEIDTILISHLHGDHFAGLVWWLLHAKFIAKRTHPLILAGPPGLRQRLQTATDAFYPGAIEKVSDLNVAFHVLEAEHTSQLGQLNVRPVDVTHPTDAPSFALRIETGDKTIAFSGDTEWTDALITVSERADLFLCECSTYDMVVPSHLNWMTLHDKLPQMSAKRIVLTHMSDDVFARRTELREHGVEVAEDGMVLDI